VLTSWLDVYLLLYKKYGWESQKERDRLEDLDCLLDDIKIDLKHVGSGDMYWINLAQDRD
jgi:hypothetical protein